MPSPPSSFANNAVGYTYHYDQLNRLKKMRQYTGIGSGSTWDRTYITLNDQENITYDGNGNILTYGRNGGDTTAQTIDSLNYNYNYTNGKLVNNQLQYIHDAVTSSGYNLDIRNQTNINNYQYDGIGNITKDIQSGITNIGWTVYNKPDTIYKAAGNITYNYNTANQRISKTYNGLTTWYIRDAQGNVLAVYDNADSSLNWREQHLYGSSRIGMWTPNINLADSNALDKWDTTGYRQFELDNHLGNVMTTINDVRVPYFKPSHIGPIPGPLQYFAANVLSYQDYYAFGMPMPDRQYVLTGDSSYRYGFNGKENDNEVMGYGNSQDYGERFYDPRIGQFRSVDPLVDKYPELSSYQFAGNKPIFAIDLDGTEDTPYDFGKAEEDIREESARLYKIDPKLSKEFEQKGNLLGFTVVGGFLTAGFSASALETGGFRAFLTNMLKGGGVGGVFSGGISWAKGDNGYEIVKSTVSGFFSGAILGMGWEKSISSILIGGGISGGVGEIVNQEFDDKFGSKKGFDLEKIAISGGVGAVANLLSSSIVSRINKVISNKLSESLAETRTPDYRKIIRNAILEKSPRIGNKELSVAINTQIKNNQAVLIMQAAQAQKAVKQAVERGVDKLQDQYKDTLKQ